MNNLRTLTYFDIYKKNARSNGSACALFWNGTATSYADLFSQTARFATGLKALGLTPGDRVAVLCCNHPVFFHLFGAASALNLVLVLVNRRLSPEEMAHIVEDTTPKAMVCDPQMADQAKALASSSGTLEQILVADLSDPAFSQLYEAPEIDSVEETKDTDPFVIIHTAAVMGKPRGAVLSQSNIILSNQQMIEAYRLNRQTSYLNILPLFHIMGINLGLGTLQAGGKNVIQEKFDANEATDLMQTHQVTLFGSFPPILNSLIEALQTHPKDLSTLDITTGLEAPDVAKQWETISGSTFWTLYGQTETSGIVTTAPYFEKQGAAGRVTPLALLTVADDADRPLPEESVGEIRIRGPLVFQGYWNAEDINRQTFRNGWHHTGDLGMTDSDGFLFFKGRKPEKELIKPGGENVFPAEVEQTLAAHDAVKDVCVFGVPDPKYGEGIKAVCSLNPGLTLTAEELIAFCGQRIAGYKKPRYVTFVDELPRTEDGRIDREKIKTDHTE